MALLKLLRALYAAASTRAELACLAGALALSLTGAACAADNPLAGSSSRKVLEDARREVPWGELSRNDQRVVQYVVHKTSLFRRTPTHVFDCDPGVFNFLIRHPEVVVNVWNVMGVSKLSLERTSEQTFLAEDQAGTRGQLRVAYSKITPDCDNKLVILADGAYQAGPVKNALDANCVMILRSASRKETDGRTYVTARLDSFIRFDRRGADLAAKTLQPLLVKSADHNFTETMKFVSTFSRTVEQRPDGLINLANRLDRVDAQTRSELAELCRLTGGRTTAAAGPQTPIRLTRLQQPSS